MKGLIAVILALGCLAAPCLADSSVTLYTGWNFVSVPVLNPGVPVSRIPVLLAVFRCRYRRTLIVAV